jgi:hypothetical protein
MAGPKASGSEAVKLDPPAIHAFALSKKQDVDARDERGHDERVSRSRSIGVG